jgi:hypothetical protein
VPRSTQAVPWASSSLINLPIALTRRFEWSGQHEDLEEAIFSSLELSDLTSPTTCKRPLPHFITPLTQLCISALALTVTSSGHCLTHPTPRPELKLFRGKCISQNFRPGADKNFLGAALMFVGFSRVVATMW